jgi:AraC-like DNA-binding protein
MATYEELIAAAQAAQNEGRGDAARLLAQRAVDLRTSAEEEPEQTVIGSIARGAGAGLVSIPQGIAELGAAGIDLAADTELSRNTTEFFEDLKDKLGFTPERTAGRIAETLVNYGAIAIPVAGWLGAASQAARAAKLGQAPLQAASRVRQSAYNFGRTGVGGALTANRVRLAGTTALGTGLADILVDPSTNETLVDTWDALPDILRTEDEAGLMGRELAATRLRNKLRVGAEGAAFTAVGEAIIPAVGAVVRGAGAIPGVPQTAQALSAGLNYIGSRLGEIPFVRKNLTSRGFVPEEIFDAVGTARNIGEAEAREASGLLSTFDTALRKSVNAQRLFGRGRKALQRGYQDTTDFLTGNMTEAAYKQLYGDKALKAAQDMRSAVDNMSIRFADTVQAAPNLTPAQKNQLLQQFQANQGQYMRRQYELFLRPEKFLGANYKQLPQYGAARQQVVNVLQTRNPTLPTAAADAQAELIIDDIFAKGLSTTGLDPAVAAKLQADAIARGGQVIEGVRAPLFRLSQGMLKDRAQLLDNAPMLRELMGEIRDPRELFLRTIDDMASTTASQRLYDNIASSGIKPYAQATAEIGQGGRPFVIDGTTVPDNVSLSGYVKLGERNADNPFGGQYGSLSGNYVPVEIYNSLTTPIRAYSGMQDALALALQAKGVSQMTKTVLNPLSQIRNFLSNTFVVGANGLLGRNMGLFESADVLMSNALNSPEQFKLFRSMANEGAIGQNIQLNELTQLLQEQTSRGVSAFLGRQGEAFKQSKIGAPVRFMEKMYQMGDDYWKIVGALGEKARYGAAFRAAGLDIDNMPAAAQQALTNLGLTRRTQSIADTGFGDLLAIDIVRNTMPTYSMVPEAIRALRRIPFIGNFMSFPAEIIRTSGNIVNRGLKEMSFKALDDTGKSLIPGLTPAAALRLQREVRAIGAQRMSGYVSMAIAAPIAAREAAHGALGITPEQEALMQQNAPFWTKGNQLMYISAPDEKGNAEYVDLSYMLPYEFMLTPARAALQEYQARGMVSDDTLANIARASWEGFSKFVEPFASEALATERVIDVTTRQGRTREGATIYEEGAELGDRLGQSLMHVVGAFIPGIVDQFVTIRGGEFAPGRVTRAITGLPSGEGDAYTIAEEVGTHLTGLRPLRLNTQRSLRYAGAEYSSLRTSASRIFTGRADNNDVDAQDVMNAYVRANEARRAHQAQLYSRIQTARNAGMSDRQIREAFRNTGVSRSELNRIMRNEFVPIDISRGLIREVNREVNVLNENRILQRLPRQDLNQLRNELRGTPLVPTGEETPAASAEPAAYVPPQPLGPANVQGAAPAAPVVGQVPAAPGPQPAVQQAKTQPPLELLGGSVVDALRNLPIAQRLSGQ